MSLISYAKKLAGLDRKKLARKKKPEPLSARKKAKVASPSRKQPPRLRPGAASGAIIDLQLLVTEKGARMSEHSVGTFRVPADATKGQIAAAVGARYGIKARKVRTVSIASKRRRRGQTKGATSAWKKAYVQVDDINALNIGV